MELKAHVWFPTLIWQATLPDEEKKLLSDMKDFILDIKEKNPEGVKKSNFGGWQSGNYKKFPKAFKLIGEKINSTIMNCAKQINVPELSLGSYWCNVNTYGDYNKLHNHRGSILSGVFYVDVPDENMGNIVFERADDIEYYLPPLKEYNNFTGGRATYTPESGKVLIFPSWLKHQVEGSRSEQQRISISFNYGV